jgi:hypothetical protein
MAKPKGPEKHLIALRVTLPTLEWLKRKAQGRPVPTYLAESIERQAEASIKNERNVNPRFKKGGK